MERFASVPEQPEAKRLLTAALAEGAAHAYLLHGPDGVGKKTAAFAFASALLGDDRRVQARSHSSRLRRIPASICSTIMRPNGVSRDSSSYERSRIASAWR